MDAGWSADYAVQRCKYAASKSVRVFLRESFGGIYRDTDLPGSDAKLYTQHLATVTNDSNTTFHMAAEGGTIIRIHAEEVTGTDATAEKVSHAWVYSNEASSQLSVQADAAIRNVTIIDLSGRRCSTSHPPGRNTGRYIATG